jgi:prephenate dehydrogenase
VGVRGGPDLIVDVVPEDAKHVGVYGVVLGDAQAHGVKLAATHAEAVQDAELVVSAVTASQAVAVAEACAAGLAPGAFFLDLNSASPGAKRNDEFNRPDGPFLRLRR